jgi:mono/diheme cytochrome c family protein
LGVESEDEMNMSHRKGVKKVGLKQLCVALAALAGILLAALIQQSAEAVSGPRQGQAVARADDKDVLTPPADIAGSAARVLDTYCIQCHGTEKQKGNVRFDALETIDTVDQQTLFLTAQDAVHFEEMPPAKAKQPTEAEREVLLAWFKEQLTGPAAKKLEEKMRRPEAGNYVDHEDLFSGDYADLPGFTYDRQWLISEYIFNEKFNRLLKHNPSRKIDGERHPVSGDSNRRVNLTNPFLLPSYKGGVRYYANETLNGGHLLTMLTNAKEAAAYMIELAKQDPDYIPALAAIMDQENRHNATLASRETFLKNHADRVFKEIYGDKNEALLPQFVPVEIEEQAAVDANGKPVKRAEFHSASPGKDEIQVIYRSMKKHQEEGDTDAQLIEKCEREWFNFGVNERVLKTRIVFMNGYMADLKKEMNTGHYRGVVPYPYEKLSDEEMEAIKSGILKHRKPGDTYIEVIQQCMADWEEGFVQERIKAGPPKAGVVRALVDQLFNKILERPPSAQETQKYTPLALSYVESLGREKAIEKLIQTLILSTEFVCRQESGQGEPDEFGRRMLSPRDASYALAYALTDSSPDQALAKAAAEGRLSTRADYEREVRRMLKRRDQYSIIDESVDSPNDRASFTNMPIRELRFFREFFGYPKMLSIFKDNKRFGANYDRTKHRLVAEADRLVEHIVEKDKDVFNELLTTDKFYVYHSGNNEAMQASSARIRRIYEYFKDKTWQDFTLEDLAEHKDFIAEVKMRGIDASRLEASGAYNPLRAFQNQMKSFELRLGKGQSDAAPYNSFPAHGMANASSRYNGRLRSPEVAKFFGIDMYDWDYQPVQPAKLSNRKGILTHPAWLIAFAANFETDPIHRGIWVREKLLADTIPDVPITVDAVIPEDPHKTLRQRLDAKTNNDYCMRCHVKINPLGIPFEIYDDFGRYRTEERLEHPGNLIKKTENKGGVEQDLRDIYKTLPVNPKGYLEGTGDSKLDGEVDDALDLIDRLAKSDRVRQSIIRHAFRYFMGRNETLNDSKTLIDADKAYLESGGSFDEVIVSLLTSDSFIYRKAPEPQAKD